MNFVPPDTCLEDYTRRRSAFLKALLRVGVPTRHKVAMLREWREKNTPYSAGEQLANLKRALGIK